MSKSAQLKRKAAEFEQKRQYDRALTSYAQAIEAAAGIADELDIPLYNRVGDLHLRLGELDKAVAYYETAVDLYAEGGFFNNAIALCNKVLRHSPDRSVIYYKLGKISAKKGFNSDAKQNFLEYASRMEKGGDINEAFRALREFADLCPGQDDVRLMLAEQLTRAGRTHEALEQLQIVYEAMLAEDRAAEATATLERIHALDPNFAPRVAMSRQRAKREGLVFLDVDYGKRGGASVSAPASSMQRPESPSRPLTAESFGAVELPPPADERATGTLDESPLAGLTPLEDPLTSMVADPSRRPEITPLTIEHTSFDTLSPDTLAPDPIASQVGESVWPVQADSLGPMSDEVAPTIVRDEQASAPPSPRSDDEFVDLNKWLLEGEPTRNPRMTAEEEDKSVNEVQTDFSEMLATFKAAVAANVDESDSDSHYDLGVAYMEMGLFDEAIAQFQKVMRGDASPERRVRAYESLGQSFIEKNEYEVAISSLGGALKESGLADTKLVGVLYLLGYASERLDRRQDAEGYYRRVFAVDIYFRDIGERLKRAEQMA